MKDVCIISVAKSQMPKEILQYIYYRSDPDSAPLHDQPNPLQLIHITPSLPLSLSPNCLKGRLHLWHLLVVTTPSAWSEDCWPQRRGRRGRRERREKGNTYCFIAAHTLSLSPWAWCRPHSPSRSRPPLSPPRSSSSCVCFASCSSGRLDRSWLLPLFTWNCLDPRTDAKTLFPLDYGTGRHFVL